MPIFLDRHDLHEMSAAEVAEAHRRDLDIQDEYGVRFLTYWFDEGRGHAFCLIDAPDIAAAMRVHQESHGNIASRMIEVDLSAVEAFLGRITDPAGPARGVQPPALDSAYRAVLFTDIVDSVSLAAKFGDRRMVELVRAHDAMVRRALTEARGREVKHTGDGIMASFDDVKGSVACARSMLQAFAAFNRASHVPLHLRIGIHAGEPVQDSNDLFGTTVQLAARICSEAPADSIVISDVVRAMLGDDTETAALGARQFKGFDQMVDLFEVGWRKPG
jgi:class 3 adenylate cyclase